jgi:hypothetical protein
MLHATCMQGTQVDFRLSVVESQIGNLTFDLSFGHNLCFKCQNDIKNFSIQWIFTLVIAP